MLTAFLLGLLTAAANVLGSYLAVIQEHPSRRAMTYSIAFGGGFLLAAALFEMIPASIERGPLMPGMIALGYLLVYFAEQLLNVHLHTIPPEHQLPQSDASERDTPTTPSSSTKFPLVTLGASISTIIAFNIHDFTDGLAIGAAMLTQARLATLVFFAVLLHEIPAGFTIAAVMRGQGIRRRTALLSGLSIGLMTLVGILVPFLIGGVDSLTTDVLLALATGTFIYVGASLLIPIVETGGFRWAFLYVGAGFIVFFVSSEFVEHFVVRL